MNAHIKETGMGVCLIGILLNLLLAGGKIAAGILSGLVAVTADGFNNLSDCGSGAADREHPYGHRRAEYVASTIAGCFVCCLAVEFFRECAESLLAGGAPAGTWAVYAVLGVSVAVKLALFALYRMGAKRWDSDALKAASVDSLCDCLASAAVVLGTALSPHFAAADGIAGLLVSLFIAWQGVKLLLEGSSKLLGQADPALAAAIRETALATEGILGVHDLMIYSYGKGASFATLHAEMDASLSMLAAHTVIDGLEMQVKKQTGVLLTVHLDPVDLADRAESALRIRLWEKVRELTEGLKLHDFRLIPGTNRVEFDVCVPYSCKIADDVLAAAIAAIVQELGDYEPVLRIERE